MQKIKVEQIQSKRGMDGSGNSISEPTDYKTLSDGDFWTLFEQERAKIDPAFYEEFQTRTAQGRHYNPTTDPQAWEKSTADFIAFMDKAGFAH